MKPSIQFAVLLVGFVILLAFLFQPTHAQTSCVSQQYSLQPVSGGGLILVCLPASTQGPAGPQGPQGPQGIPGPQGPAGAPGSSPTIGAGCPSAASIPSTAAVLSVAIDPTHCLPVIIIVGTGPAQLAQTDPGIGTPVATQLPSSVCGGADGLNGTQCILSLINVQQKTE